MTDRPCVVVATAASRDPIALALAADRPGVDVVGVEPAELGAVVVRRRPRLVICDAPNEVVATRVGAWVLLHPDGANLAVVGLDGARRTVRCPGFADLLAAVDAAVAAAVAAPPATAA